MTITNYNPFTGKYINVITLKAVGKGRYMACTGHGVVSEFIVLRVGNTPTVVSRMTISIAPDENNHTTTPAADISLRSIQEWSMMISVITDSHHIRPISRHELIHSI